LTIWVSNYPIPSMNSTVKEMISDDLMEDVCNRY
jgi:hypothetical protein